MARTRSSRTAVPFRASHFRRAGVQATQMTGFTHRHRILALVRPDGCCAYAIPVPKLEGTFKLPDIELTAGELDSYLRIANSITPAPAEYTVQCPHPARTAVKSNRTEWRSNELNPEALGQLLQQHANWLFPVITARTRRAAPQLRSVCRGADLPVQFYGQKAEFASRSSNYSRIHSTEPYDRRRSLQFRSTPNHRA